MRLPPEARPLLKRPLGKLFTSTGTAVEHIKKMHPARLIAVGDTVAAELLGAGLEPDLIVVDFQVKRVPDDDKTRRAIEAYNVQSVRVRNPAGSLTQELYNIFDTIKIPAKIIVEGEDDLATIPAVLSAPIGSIVAYGQPNEGIVLVEVDEYKKQEFRKLLELFDRGMS